MSVRTEDITRQVRQLFDAGSAVGLTDAELLARVGEKHVKATRATLAALIGIGRDLTDDDDGH